MARPIRTVPHEAIRSLETETYAHLPTSQKTRRAESGKSAAILSF